MKTLTGIGIALGVLGCLFAPVESAGRPQADPDLKESARRIEAILALHPDAGALQAAVDPAPLKTDALRLSTLLSAYAHASALSGARRWDEALAALDALDTPPEERPVWLREQEARLRMRLGNRDAAIRIAREILKERPKRTNVSLMLADMLEKQEQSGEALVVLENARRQDPRNHRLLDALGRKYAARLGGASDRKVKEQALEKLRGVYEDLVDARPGRSSVPYLEVLSYVSEEANDLAGAREYLERALRIEPNQIKTHLHLHSVLVRLGEKEAAVESLRRMTRLEPRNPAVLETVRATLGGLESERALNFYAALAGEFPGRDDLQILYAQTLDAQNRSNDAAEVLRASLEHHPRNPETWLQLARVEARAGDSQTVREALRAYLDLVSRDVEPHLRAARLFAQFQYYDDAWQVVQRAEEIAPDNPEVETLALQILIRTGRTEEALERLRTALERDPARLSRYPMLVETLESLARLGEAVEPLEAGREAVSEADKAFLEELLADVLIRLGRHAEALKLLDDRLTRDDDTVSLHLLRLKALDGLDRGEEALTDLERLLARHPGNDVLRLARIDLLRGMERMDEAAERLREEVDRRPGEWRLKLTLAALYNEAGRPESTEALLREVADARREDPEALHEIGLVKWDLKQFADAEVCFRAAIKLEPGEAEHYNSLGYLFAEQGKRLDEALALVQKALDLAPDAGHIVDSLGWVYYKQGRYQKAVEALERASRLESGDPTVFEHLGDAYNGAGEPEKARAPWRRALEILRENPHLSHSEQIESLERKLRESAAH